MAFLKTHTSSSFWKETVPRSHFVDFDQTNFENSFTDVTFCHCCVLENHEH